MVVLGCGVHVKRTLHQPQHAEHLRGLRDSSPYLKAHYFNGELVILHDWDVAEDGTSVRGIGEHYDVHRKILAQGPLVVEVSQVALFESNVRKRSPIAGMIFITGVTAAVTVACLTHPKACFGSCPTFYASDGTRSFVQAEAFSESIAPALEARDLDALYRVAPSGRQFTLRVTNEALETHVIRRADLIVAERPNGGRVFASPSGDLFGATNVMEPARCHSDAGDCSTLVGSFDGREYQSTTNGVDLADKEVLELGFDAPAGGRYGLIVGARQTFITTYLFYQALGYLGRRSTEILAGLSTGDLAAGGRLPILSILGGIDVQLEDAGEWKTVSSFDEPGPIATDVQVIPLPEGSDPRSIRLSMTRGHVRIDWLALASLGDAPKSWTIAPSKVTTGDRANPDLAASLADDRRTLVTMPGDSHTLVYDLPREASDLEFFLSAQGYYLEWIRDEWLEEENSAMALMMLFAPRTFLRVVAPSFKEIEPEMEELFQRSRYAAP